MEFFSFRHQRRSHYAVLGLERGASGAEIRAAYRKEAMKWHPDRWSRDEEGMAEKAKRRFQEIQQAYQLLSNGSKRSLYDLGLYDQDGETEEEAEGLAGFVRELSGMMAEERKAGKRYGLEDLQWMLQDMMGGASTAPPPSLRGTDAKPAAAGKRTRPAMGGLREPTDLVRCMA